MPHISDPLLQAYIDGFCNEERVDEIESHVEACGDCRERLELARAAAQRASQLLGTLEPGPVHAPSFEELQARATARATAGTDRAGARAADGAVVPGSATPVALPFWRRPALAWAATLVIAFGLGWVTRSIPGPPVELAAPQTSFDELGSAAMEPQQEAAGEAGARENVAALDEVDDLRGEVAKRAAVSELEAQPAGPPSASVEEQAQSRQQMAQNQAKPEPDPSRGLRAAVAEAPTAAATPLAVVTPGEAVESPPAASPPPPPLQGRNEQLAATFADAGTTPGFVPVPREQIELWLGVAPREIPDLTLVRVEVAPGAVLTDGIVGRNAARLVYRADSGQEIVLLQQYTGPLEGQELRQGEEVSAGRDAGAGAPARDERARAVGAFRADSKEAADRDLTVAGVLDLPTTIRQPGGPTTYRWIDAGGYLLSITGDVDPDVLRGLADLVR